MAREEGKGSSGPRSRYVWDTNKLAWVETTEEPQQEEVAKEEPRHEKLEQRKTISAPRHKESAEEYVAEPEPFEAVEEVSALDYKGALIRFLAFIIDFVILTIIMTIISYITDIPRWPGVLLGLIYFVGFWTWRGQTPGMMIIRAKIVKTDGSKVSIINAVLRYIFYLIPSFAPILFLASIYGPIARIMTWIIIIAAIIGLVVIGFNPKKQGIHDLVAGTCVINTRTRVFQPEIAEPTIESSEANEPDATQQD